MSEYKKLQKENFKKRLSFEDLLKIYLRFLQNPKVQKQKYLDDLKFYLEDRKQGLRKIKKMSSKLETNKESLFFLKAFLAMKDEFEAHDLWTIWDTVEESVLTFLAHSSLSEMQFAAELMTELGLNCPQLMHFLENEVIDAKSEIFRGPRDQIFKTIYGFTNLFVRQKEVRSEFFYSISKWSVLMAR